MITVIVKPKESEKEWFKARYYGSNFNWNDSLKNGLKIHTYNLEGLKHLKQTYQNKVESITVIK